MALILSGDTGVPASGMPTGSVIQVQSTTKTNTFSTTSTSFTDVTGLSVSITPISTSSKILVIYSLPSYGLIIINSKPSAGNWRVRNSHYFSN